MKKKNKKLIFNEENIRRMVSFTWVRLGSNTCEALHKTIENKHGLLMKRANCKIFKTKFIPHEWFMLKFWSWFCWCPFLLLFWASKKGEIKKYIRLICSIYYWVNVLFIHFYIFLYRCSWIFDFLDEKEPKNQDKTMLPS